MNKYIEVNLHDAESGEEFTMKLSPTDALKVQNDMSFATMLLNVARQACNTNARQIYNNTGVRQPFKNNGTQLCNNIGASVGISEHTVPLSTCSSNNVTTLTTDDIPDDMDSEKIDNDLENLSGDNFRWSNEAVLLLLEEYRKYEKDMSSGKITHKKAWEKISEVMNENGYAVTGRQCSTRFNTMKRTYKGVKDHNNKSGNNKRTWPYFEIMNSLLGTKPYMAPLSTLSSTASSTAVETSVRCNSSCSNSSTSSTMDMDLDNNVPRKRKKSDDIASAILESRAIAETGKEKRHKERMESRLQLLEKLDKILNKL